MIIKLSKRKGAYKIRQIKKQKKWNRWIWGPLVLVVQLLLTIVWLKISGQNVKSCGFINAYMDLGFSTVW